MNEIKTKTYKEQFIRHMKDFLIFLLACGIVAIIIGMSK